MAPGLPESFTCSELGGNSASQDTSLQSACEGGPSARALCFLCPDLARPSSVHPPWGPPCGHLLGSSPGRGHSWKQPIQVPQDPRAEIRGSRAGDWGGGAVTGPKPPFWLPLKVGALS